MDGKLFTVVIDDVPTLNLELRKEQTIGDIKNYLFKEYPLYSIKLYMNKKSEVKIFDTDKYHDMTLETVWIQLDSPKFYLKEKELKNKQKETKSQCVKIASLRKVYGKDIDFRKWLEDPENVYVGRYGRIFIDKEIFHYPESKWANPFKVKDYPLEESLKLYRKHLSISGLLKDIEELRGKTLGCFCDTASIKSNKIDCHTKVLLSFL